MKKIRFAIIGCGRIAPKHAEAIKKNSAAELVMVCDVLSERAKSFAEKYDAPWTTDYTDIAYNPDVDVVSICTPSGLHAKMGRNFAALNKNILVEKPMALDIRDAKGLINTCAHYNVALGVILQNRYNFPMKDLKREIENKTLGRLLMISSGVRWYRPERYYDDVWHGTKGMGGGVLLNQACHHLDALEWIGGPIESVKAYHGTLARKIECPDAVVASFKFKNGALGMLEASVLSYPKNVEGSITVMGTNGTVKVGGHSLNEKEIWRIGGALDEEINILDLSRRDTRDVYGRGHKYQYADFIRALLVKGKPKPDGIDGIKSLRLALAIHEAAEENREVIVE